MWPNGIVMLADVCRAFIATFRYARGPDEVLAVSEFEAGISRCREAVPGPPPEALDELRRAIAAYRENRLGRRHLLALARMASKACDESASADDSAWLGVRLADKLRRMSLPAAAA